jgi:hypothetical protein
MGPPAAASSQQASAQGLQQRVRPWDGHVVTDGGGIMKKTLVLIAVAAVVAGAGLAGAHANRAAPLTIVMDGTLTGPNTIAGTWHSTGLIEASGTYTQEFRFAGNSIHDEKTLVSPQGTLAIKVQALFAVAPDGTVTFSKGSWQVVEATGAYEGLHAGGQPGAAAESFGSLATGQVHIRHDGSGHFD